VQWIAVPPHRNPRLGALDLTEILAGQSYFGRPDRSWKALSISLSTSRRLNPRMSAFRLAEKFTVLRGISSKTGPDEK
jgi:hypothetical protein